MKQIFLILAFFSIQFSAHAYELLSCKTTVSPGYDGGVLEHITESHISNEYMNGLRTSFGVFTDTKAFSAIGNTNQMVTLQSRHSFSANNDTSNFQNIKVVIILSTHEKRYTSNEYTFRLKPGEKMNDSANLYFKTQYNKAGNYKVYAQTIISGDISSSANDSNNVTIR